MTWHREMARNVVNFQERIPDSKKGFVLYAGDLYPESEGYQVRHFKEIGGCLR